jgi:DNA-binding NarL/FixJ family response regulator
VLLVECGSLFDEGLVSRLRREPDLQITTVASSDEEAFLCEVVRRSPDVILLNEAGPLGAMRVFSLLKGAPLSAPLRVITVRMDDNKIEKFEKQTVIAHQWGQLLALIRPSDHRE